MPGWHTRLGCPGRRARAPVELMAQDGTSGIASPSQSTIEKSRISKLLIESHFQNLAKEKTERVSRRRTLEQQLERLQCSPVERADALKELGQNETVYHRIRRQKMSIDDYILVKVIGRGAFGEVRLCRSRADPEQLYAIKVNCYI